MNEAKLIEAFMDTLRHDPTAAPPPGLDRELAAWVREVVLAERDSGPNADALARMWRRALSGAQPGPGSQRVTGSSFSDNGRGPTMKHTEETKMESVLRGSMVLPRRRAVPSARRFVALAAAIGAVLFVGFLLSSLLTNPGGDSGAVYISPEKANQAVFELYINEAWNAGNTAVLSEVLTAEHVCYEPGQPEGVGVEHVAALIGTYRAAFPDWQFAIEDLVATEDAVWARLVGTGTQNGPFAWAEGVTVDATGSAVTLDVMIAARFADGKITEQRFEYDALGLLGQLQAVPSLETYLTEQRNMELARRMFDESFNQRNVDATDDYYVDPSLWHSGTKTPGNMPNSFRKEWLVTMLWPAFPDLQVTVERMAAAGDLVFVQVTFRGTFENRFQSPVTDNWIEPTHQERTWSWLIIERFEDGKIAEQWQYEDMEYKR